MQLLDCKAIQGFQHDEYSVTNTALEAFLVSFLLFRLLETHQEKKKRFNLMKLYIYPGNKHNSWSNDGADFESSKQEKTFLQDLRDNAMS